MSVRPQHRMSVDEFLAWAEDRPGHYELVDGEVVAMSPQRVRHAAAKFVVQTALKSAIQAAGVPCRMLPDGLSVPIDAQTVFEPDAFVYCGAPLDPDLVLVREPMIVVEVLSPGTNHVDTGRKLRGYFQLPSVRHYLIVDAEKRYLIHHRRGVDDLIETRIAATGRLILDPPGLRLDIADVFAPADDEPERPLA